MNLEILQLLRVPRRDVTDSWFTAHLPSLPSPNSIPHHMRSPTQVCGHSSPCIQYPSCKQLPLGHSSNLGMCVVAAPLGEWVGERFTPAGWKWIWGSLDREYRGTRYPECGLRWAHPLGLVGSSLHQDGRGQRGAL